jgi:hypothetical protein
MRGEFNQAITLHYADHSLTRNAKADLFASTSISQ